MNDRTKVMIAIAGTALVVGGASAIASSGNSGGNGAQPGSQAGSGMPFAAGAERGFHTGGPRGDGPHGGLHGDAIGAAADYLGLTEQQLADQLVAGKSLAQVAAATSGKTLDGLKAAIKAEAKADVDKDVAAGRVTAAERDAFLAAVDARIADLVDRTGFALRGPGGGPGGHHGGHGVLAAAAVTKYLGLTQAQLGEQLRAGKSLAEIAVAQGKTVAGLKDAMTADAKTHLDAEVAAGELTAAEAAQRLADLKTMLDEIVQNKGFGHPGGMHAGFRPAVRA
jgi:hypothetical protein